MKNAQYLYTLLAFSLPTGVTACDRERQLPAVEAPSHLYARALRTAAIGCYRLDPYGVTDARWRQQLMRHLGVFRLGKDSVFAPEPGRREVTGIPRTANDSLRGVVFRWVADSLTDSIDVGGGDGFTGFAIIVAPNATGWSGRAEYWEDVGPPFEHDLGLVRVASIPCAETSYVAPPAHGR